MKFTFGVLAYNQEALILETLESIKYQIINYGKDYNTRIIVIDDHSNDFTAALCNKWIKDNEKIVINGKCIINDINRGTVYNYNMLMEMIEDETFKIIAGDDLLASTNIYEETLRLKENELSTYCRICLKNERIFYEERSLVNFYWQIKQKKTQAYNLKQMRRGGYLHTPSTIYLKKTYINGHCQELNSNFRLFEDDPTWYSMIKYIDVLKINFYKKCIVLYRIHEKSVSNSQTNKSPFTFELMKLRKIYAHESKGFEKIYLLFRSNDLLPKLMRVDLLIDKIIILYRKSILCLDKGFKEFRKDLEQIVQEEQKYYNKIKKIASDQMVQGEDYAGR